MPRCQMFGSLRFGSARLDLNDFVCFSVILLLAVFPASWDRGTLPDRKRHRGGAEGWETVDERGSWPHTQTAVCSLLYFIFFHLPIFPSVRLQFFVCSTSSIFIFSHSSYSSYLSIFTFIMLLTYSHFSLFQVSSVSLIYSSVSCFFLFFIQFATLISCVYRPSSRSCVAEPSGANEFHFKSGDSTCLIYQDRGPPSP